MPASNPYNPYFTTGMMPTTIMGHEHAALASSNPIPHSMSLAAATTTIHNAAQNQKRTDRIQVILFKLLSLLLLSISFTLCLYSLSYIMWNYLLTLYTYHTLHYTPCHDFIAYKVWVEWKFNEICKKFFSNSTKTVSFSSGSDFINATSNRLKCQMHIHTNICSTYTQCTHPFTCLFPQY